jgi:type II secretory pathway component GspD/PulD (secretin)
VRLLACAVATALLLVAVPAYAQQSDRFTLDARDVELADVIRLLGARSRQNVVADGSVKPQRVTLTLRDVTFDEALATVATAYALQIHRDGRTYIVGDAAAMSRRYPDEATPGASQTRVFSLARAKPEELAAALQGALPPGSVVVADRRTGSVLVTASAPAIERASRIVAAFDAPNPGSGGANSTSVALHNVRASDALKTLKGALPDGALLAEDRQNVVLVTGNAEIQTAARALLAGIDGPGRQVMFEVRVADVQPVNDQTNVGFEFAGAGYGSGGGAIGQFPYTLTKSSIVVNAQINALIQHGRAKILAQPRIATLNNREASLLVGSQYPVVTVNQQTGYPSVQTIDVGVRLRLTPTIGPDGEITAEMHPEYSQIIGFNTSFPIVANRKVDSTLRVRDGETIVLGGLFEEVDNETITRVPFLADLPVLGAFFRNRQASHSRDEVVFFITPRILASDGTASGRP